MSKQTKKSANISFPKTGKFGFILQCKAKHQKMTKSFASKLNVNWISPSAVERKKNKWNIICLKWKRSMIYRQLLHVAIWLTDVSLFLFWCFIQSTELIVKIMSVSHRVTVFQTLIVGCVNLNSLFVMVTRGNILSSCNFVFAFNSVFAKNWIVLAHNAKREKFIQRAYNDFIKIV